MAYSVFAFSVTNLVTFATSSLSSSTLVFAGIGKKAVMMDSIDLNPFVTEIMRAAFLTLDSLSHFFLFSLYIVTLPRDVIMRLVAGESLISSTVFIMFSASIVLIDAGAS